MQEAMWDGMSNSNEPITYKSYFINCSGCARSGMNAEKMKTYLNMNGFKEVDNPESADFIFMLTCGLPSSTPHELKLIPEYQKLKGELIVCGCLPAMEPERLTSVFNGKTVITKELDKIGEMFPNFQFKFRDIDDPNRLFRDGHYHQYTKDADGSKIGINKLLRSIWEHEITLPSLNRTRLPRFIDVDPDQYSIRISRGCAGNCSYCAIRFAVGKLHSKEPDEIIREVIRAISRGTYKISLVSDDTGAYGQDIGTNIVNLLKQILNIDPRIEIEYLQDLNPLYLCRYGDELVDLIRTKRIKSFQTAIQSGSERVLRLMNRPTDVKRYKTLIEKMRKVYPGIKIRNQIIVGFPSETEEDFNETKRLLKECKFDQVDVYQYHEYKLCNSTMIFPKVSKEIKINRQRELIDLGTPQLIIFSRINLKRISHYIGSKLRIWKEPLY